jgi:hypothetical protein
MNLPVDVAAATEEANGFTEHCMNALQFYCRLTPGEAGYLMTWAIAERLSSSMPPAEFMARLESFPDAVPIIPDEVASIVCPPIEVCHATQLIAS